MGTWTRVVRATSAAHSGKSMVATARHVLTSFVRATAICVGAAKAAQTTAIASQEAAAASALGIATGENGIAAVCFAVAALALMETAHDHVAAAPAQLVAVTAQIKRSFCDNVRQPTAEELAIAERVRAVVRSCAAYLATTKPARAQIAAAHAQVVAAYSKDMADTDGEMLAEYGAIDAMEPQEIVARELDMEAAAEIDEHQP